jgi:hypothetical protein
MPLYEITLTETYQNQVTINRWNYLLTGTPAAVIGAFALVSAFGSIYDEVHVPPQYPTGTVLDALSYIQNAGVAMQQITALNPYDPTDFYQTPFVVPYVGRGADTGVSPTVAVGFRTTQVRRDISRATKRFVGVSESQVGQGGALDISNGSRINDVAIAMTNVLTYDDEGNTLSFAPCVVGKEKYTITQPSPKPPTVAYRYYPTEAEQLEHIAAGIIWQAYANTRTQVSRQYGRGR